MPKYKLPALKKQDKMYDSPVTEGVWQRRITVPINSAIMKALETGGNATVTLKGKVVGMTDRENERSLEFEIKQVEAYGADEREGMTQKEYERSRRKDGK